MLHVKTVGRQASEQPLVVASAVPYHLIGVPSMPRYTSCPMGKDCDMCENALERCPAAIIETRYHEGDLLRAECGAQIKVEVIRNGVGPSNEAPIGLLEFYFEVCPKSVYNV
jgi:hypothetical protein